MFQGLFRRAETTIDTIVAKYTARIMVAVPFVVALGFATAAATVKVVEVYGQAAGLSIMAGVFAVLTLATMAAVGTGVLRDDGHGSEDEMRTGADEPERLASEVDSMLTPELRAVLGAAAPMALPVVARAVVRNLPLLILAALIIYIFSRYAQSSEEGGGEMSVADAMAASQPPV
jgi:hypothetical protein